MPLIKKKKKKVKTPAKCERVYPYLNAAELSCLYASFLSLAESHNPTWFIPQSPLVLAKALSRADRGLRRATERQLNG